MKRTINGETKRYIEVLRETVVEIKQAFYVDSGLYYEGASTNTLSGLDHLEGETVQILAEGSVHPDRVVEGGSITLQRSVICATVGLGYRTHIQPMRIEAGARDGTAQGKIKRINRIVFRLDETVGFKYGDDMENLFIESFRDSSMAMNQPIPLFTGDKEVHWPGGYSVDSLINIVQDDPLPLTLIAIYPQVVTQDR